jgi:hypothetical protein
VSDLLPELLADGLARQTQTPAVVLFDQFQQTAVAFLVVRVVGVLQAVLRDDAEFVEQGN